MKKNGTLKIVGIVVGVLLGGGGGGWLTNIATNAAVTKSNAFTLRQHDDRLRSAESQIAVLMEMQRASEKQGEKVITELQVLNTQITEIKVNMARRHP